MNIQSSIDRGARQSLRIRKKLFHTALILAGLVTLSAASCTGPRLRILARFDNKDGSSPNGTLITDAAGNLFGTTEYGGTNTYGTVYELSKTATGYSRKPTTLASFTSPYYIWPTSGAISDAAGNLFGTTFSSVFEIAKTDTGYDSTPTNLITFPPYGASGLTIDASGNLFGTMSGTVFEIEKTDTGYASTPTTLVSFNTNPNSLMIDASGNLFGTTYSSGASNLGTVFEIAKTDTGYASTATTLATFDGSNGAYPTGGLVADAAGNLFGTTLFGGTSNLGTVFEIARTDAGYANTPTTLVSFNGANGAVPESALILDAAGNLFGTTSSGGPPVLFYGTAFKIAKTATGYADTPTTLVSFDGWNGAAPRGGLIANAAGDLFGTTAGIFGTLYPNGTLFELTNAGFVTAADLPRQ